jgi:hypothetical protein
MPWLECWQPIVPLVAFLQVWIETASVVEKLSQKAMLAGIYQNLGIASKSQKIMIYLRTYIICLNHLNLGNISKIDYI